jgi:AcrR family transcriptional regulator
MNGLHTLIRMGRYKTISDHEVLAVARDLFRVRGHNATTRQIAEAAGISEAILYQRFGSKNELFFKAMHAIGPDIEKLLGPREPSGDARAYLHGVVVRLGRYFSEVIPLALRVMTHPSFDPGSLARAQPNAAAGLRESLSERLAFLARRRAVAKGVEAVTARLLVSLAHNWALEGVLSPAASVNREAELKKMVDVVWDGLRPP